MAASARIDELRSKFDDNPRRFFAPLANEYRKAGDLETAIAICRTQLRLYPSHMSGHVVLGQALFEAGQHAEARDAFRHAVELDPENLIALRHLGDIGRSLGDDDDARRWYQRALAVDPANDEIASHLASLERPPAHLEVAAPGVAAPDVSPPAQPEPETAASDAPVPEPEPMGFVDLSADDFQWAPAAPNEPVPERTSEPTPEPASAFDAAAALDDAWEPLDVFAPAELTESPAAPGDAPQPAEEPEVDSAHVPESEPTPEPAPQTVAAPQFDPVVGLDLAPPEDAAPLDEVVRGAFVTETMAELCLQQGHDEQALDIYEQLVRQRPDDAALAGRMRALRARLAPSAAATAGVFLQQLADRRPAGAPPPAAEPAAPEPASVGPTAAEAVEEPVHADAEATARDVWAADAWSAAFRADAAPSTSLLDEIGYREPAAEQAVERAPEAAAAAPEPQAAPPDSSAPVAAEPADVSQSAAEPLDLSFDRFFVGLEEEPVAHQTPDASTEPTPAEPTHAAPAAPMPPAASPAPAEPQPAVEESEDDLAEFNAWLRGLRDS